MMDWLQDYYKELDEIQKSEKRELEQKMLDDLKKQHFEEKQQQINLLIEKLEILKKDIESYQGIKS